MATTSTAVLARKWIMWSLVLGVFTAGTALVWHLHALDGERRRMQDQEQAFRLASDLRAHIEYEINTTLNLTQGLLVYVSANPHLTQADFERFGRHILRQAPYVANIGLARDNVISHLYPLAGNERALGLRYMDNPAQREPVLRAIAARRAVVAGPVALVQGGEGLISRIPIFLSDAGEAYWGIASIVVRLEPFLRSVGLLDTALPLRIALRGKDALGAKGDVFYGDTALFTDTQAQQLKIALPEGEWVLAAAARAAPTDLTNDATPSLLFGQGLTILVSVLLYAVLSSNAALRRAKQETEVAHEHKSRFFTNMTHELRTPLTAIHGAIRLLSSGTLPADSEKSRDLLNNASRNCSRLMWIVNDILDLKKLESGKMEYHRTPQAIGPVLSEAADELREYATQHDIHIEVTDDTAGAPIDIDTMRCQQVVVNLLSNAVKHSPAGSRVDLRATATNGRLRVEVSDCGDGIPEDKIAQIFTEFSHGTTAHSHVVPSTGLGLSISRHIVQDHGGSIGCQNQPTGGALFWFDLPLATESAPTGGGEQRA